MDQAQGSPSEIRLEIPLAEQRLFGFLLDSVEGLATHSRIEGYAALSRQLMDGREAEFQSFLQAWERFRA